MADELLTKDEAGAILGVAGNAMTRYLREIRHIRLGNPRTGPVRIRRSDLEAWMERRTVAPMEDGDGDTKEVRAREPAPTRQRRPVGRKAPGRPGRLSLLHGDGPGRGAPTTGRGEEGAGSEDLVFPSRRTSRA